MRVAVVSSGNELIKSGKKIKDHQVYDSNKYQIIHFLKKFNISVDDLGILKDDEIKVDKFYKKNQNKFDIIISSGLLKDGHFVGAKHPVDALHRFCMAHSVAPT